MLTHPRRTKIDPLCHLSICGKLNYITGHSGIPVVEHEDDLESEILQLSVESLGEMSWLYNERCGIVQSPSVDDLEAALSWL